MLGHVRVADHFTVKAQQLIELRIVVVVGKMHVTTAIKLFATAISKFTRLATPEILFRCLKVTRLMLSRRQHVRDLLWIGHTVLKSGFDDQPNRRLPIHTKAFSAPTTSIAHSILRTCISLEFVVASTGIADPKMRCMYSLPITTHF
ncbi:hypothetical protein C2859_14750 [Xanthomonas citri pv. glycines]|nr:hypothetical protein A9D66_14180 [Xanthomonas citri pv. glycines str. 12-2]QEQ74101.1 hypothetical protein C2859_14750 [Xanthomonas citri pv. glycines]